MFCLEKGKKESTENRYPKPKLKTKDTIQPKDYLLETPLTRTWVIGHNTITGLLFYYFISIECCMGHIRNMYNFVGWICMFFSFLNFLSDYPNMICHLLWFLYMTNLIKLHPPVIKNRSSLARLKSQFEGP